MPATTLNAVGESIAELSVDVTTGSVTGRRAIFANGSNHAVNVSLTADTNVTVTEITLGTGSSSESPVLDTQNFVVPGNSFVLIHYNHTGTGTTDSLTIAAGGATARHKTAASVGGELALALVS